jgi:hypothetical protein
MYRRASSDFVLGVHTGIEASEAEIAPRASPDWHPAIRREASKTTVARV